MPGDTIQRRFQEQAERLGDRAAIHYRAGGDWHAVSWTEFAEEVRETAMGLASLGVEPGDAVCILSGNRPEWHVADMAGMAAGARTVPVYHTNSPSQVAYVVGHSGGKAIFVQNEEQLRKVEKERSELPNLEHAIVFDEYPESADGFVVSMSKLRELGRAFDREHPGEYDRRWQHASPDDVATIVYTSGTTGDPKGAMLTHANVISAATSLLQVFDEQPGTGRRISYLPLSHIAERMTSDFTQMYNGVEAWFAEAIDTLLRDLVECKPTVFFAVPRVWEKFHQGIQAKLAALPDEQRQMAEGAIEISKAVVEMRQEGEEPIPEMLHGLEQAEAALVAPARAALWRDQCVYVVSGAP